MLATPREAITLSGAKRSRSAIAVPRTLLRLRSASPRSAQDAQLPTKSECTRRTGRLSGTESHVILSPGVRPVHVTRATHRKANWREHG